MEGQVSMALPKKGERTTGSGVLIATLGTLGYLPLLRRGGKKGEVNFYPGREETEQFPCVG